MTDRRPPVKKFRSAVVSPNTNMTVNVWEHRSEDGRVFYSTSDEMKKRGRDGEWRPCNYTVAERMEQMRLIQKAIEWVADRMAAQRGLYREEVDGVEEAATRRKKEHCDA